MTKHLPGQFGIEGKVAIVTGASSGIGARLATVLSQAGASVVLAARREERIAALSSTLQDSIHVVCDVTLDHDLENLVARTIERFGKIDICVNNAGIAEPLSALEESPAQFRRIVETNLTSVFVLSQLVAQKMIDLGGGGTIVNVASVLGLIASNSIPQASYTASKAGVVNLTRELAYQWAKHKIRVNAIAPGWFPSEMTSVMFEEGRGLSWINRNTPLGRGGNIDELDGPLLLLASDASSYITGQTLVVDGGWSLT
ncbi:MULTISPECIES: glucose 1-dehydrogenase [Acidithrix]|uniref:2-dehydro-3-deoxy-D-gluconate 5-dehydrogenase n=1 Tax=Acidithrix ferrooxidans TaxID=1280514 RepID=A0A0D8HIS8_9ACTN|nr:MULTISPECIES: glucose 1-dehydrogenase [Acidithrix]KJF17692.1 2-dehydro-3-deoxy-D-gluconate 5-dehydrogenase [Acidithrix ferrooxidans]CAG4924522.1 unnamed protein product [Acidithrix sp. C25]